MVNLLAKGGTTDTSRRGFLTLRVTWRYNAVAPAPPAKSQLAKAFAVVTGNAVTDESAGAEDAVPEEVEEVDSKTPEEREAEKKAFEGTHSAVFFLRVRE